MALLQGFPATYMFEGPLTAKYNQIGDAVPPMVSEQIARHIIQLKSGTIDTELEVVERPLQLRLLEEAASEIYDTAHVR